jgi:hypothetical protein
MVLAIWDDGVWQDSTRVGTIGLVAYLLVLWVAALVWTYRDVASRSRDPYTQGIALLLVVVFNLPGLLLYVILRPKDTLAEAYDRRLEAEALLHEIQEQATCPACRRKIESDFLVCPYCRSVLRTPCASCAKPMLSMWVLCPHCGTDRSAEQPSPRPQQAAVERPVEPAMRVKRASTATYTPPASTPADPADAGS